MKKITFFNLSILIPLIFLFFLNCKQNTEMQNIYKLYDTVFLSGIINKSNYLSKSNNSDKEYFNYAFILQLKNNIEIIDKPDLNKVYKNISHIEIENPYEFDVSKYSDKDLKIKGILKPFIERPGYYRQYSTPVKMQIVEIEAKNYNCISAKEDALKDIEKNKISLYIFGPKRYESSFTEFFQKYLNDNYKINLVIYGCEPDEYIECYQQMMAKELEGKYGINYLEKFENEAKLRFDKKKIINNKD
jgi:hypothetical protein